MQTTKTITKRIWGVLLALCMLLSLMPMAAFAAEDPGVVYDYQFVTEDTIEIMGYNGTETNLVIPFIFLKNSFTDKPPSVFLALIFDI